PTVRAIGPTWSRVGANGLTPAKDKGPWVGFIPATPQNEAGRVIDPPVWVPMAARHMPQATAAAEPLDEPPGVRSSFQGLRVTGGSIQAYGVVTVLPRITAPALRRLATMVASASAMLRNPRFDPQAVARPATSMMSLIPIGIPCKGPRSLPPFSSSSRRRA